MPNSEPQVEPEPIVIERTGSLFLGGLAIAVASVWFIVPLRPWLALDPGAAPGFDPITSCLIAAVGLGFALWGIDQCARREVIVIARDTVSRTDARLFGVDSWCEPLRHYHGLLRRLETRAHHRGARSWQVIDLDHADPFRVVTLARERDPAIADRWWRQLRALGLAEVAATTGPAAGVVPGQPAPEGDLAALG